MNAQRYHKHTAGWLKQIGPNRDGELQHELPSNIACRYENVQRLVKNREGAEVISQATVFTCADVQQDDIIEYKGVAYPVLSVSEITELRTGAFFENEVYLGGNSNRQISR